VSSVRKPPFFLKDPSSIRSGFVRFIHWSFLPAKALLAPFSCTKKPLSFHWAASWLLPSEVGHHPSLPPFLVLGDPFFSRARDCHGFPFSCSFFLPGCPISWPALAPTAPGPQLHQAFFFLILLISTRPSLSPKQQRNCDFLG